MLYLLSFLLSWLSGMLVILISASFSFNQFSLIDIVSFGMISFAGFLMLFLLLYLPFLKLLKRKIEPRKQFLYLPLIFILISNLPAYFLLWYNMYDLYGRSEAILFAAGFAA